MFIRFMGSFFIFCAGAVAFWHGEAKAQRSTSQFNITLTIQPICGSQGPQIKCYGARGAEKAAPFALETHTEVRNGVAVKVKTIVF